MRLAISSLLSLILFSNSLIITITYGWYTLNIDSFIEQLCENKDKPALECNGKCFLSKVSEDSSKDKNSKIPSIERQELVYYQVEYLIEILNTSFEVKEANFWYNKNGGYLHQISIFHPPRHS